MLLEAPRFLSNGYIFHLLFGTEFHNPMQIGAALELCVVGQLDAFFCIVKKNSSSYNPLARNCF